MDEERISLFLLWKYYASAAEVFGRIRKENKDGTVTEKQANYSLRWFFSDTERLQLNDLTRAFLGDREAWERLPWNKPKPDADAIRPYFLEGERNQPGGRQIDAIRTALAKPISFIQGPPGTGKTATILNLLSCIVAQGKTAAVVSTNNSALEAICDKMEDFQPGENQDRLKEKLQKLGRREAREKVYQELKDRGELEDFQSDKEPYLVRGKTETVTREKQLRMQDFLRLYPIIVSTINSLKLCFHNPDNHLYDYVIVDESSQVDVVKGLVAMSCARHLVLVGDEEQLPPVLMEERIEQFEDEYIQAHGRETLEQIPEVLRLKKEDSKDKEQSFLEICQKIFLGTEFAEKDRKVFLNEHYRCHPGIIGFCNAWGIYKEPLDIKTEQYDKSIHVPIKILWYEGDYCEPYDPPATKKNKDEKSKKKKSRHNAKQIEIFLNEEWPELEKRINNGEISSNGICILSPFKGQIEDLEISLGKRLKEQQEGRNIDIFRIGESQEDEDPKANDGRDNGLVIKPKTTAETGTSDCGLPNLLTIHKSQGKEFDIVYLLPVEDADWEWPWSQKKRLVNVAVSRAKKELRLIVSTLFMKPEMQKRLTGRSVIPKEKHSDGSDEMYIQHLVDYVYEYGTTSDRDKGFGFHRTKRVSLFDAGPWLKQQEDSPDPWMSVPERCMAHALKDLRPFTEGKLVVYRSVRISDIQDSGYAMTEYGDSDHELAKYIENGAEFDFVICKKDTDQILMAIEVDGSYHRFDNRCDQLDRQNEADQKKNKLAGTLFYADCFQWSSRDLETCQPEENGTFLFLRLPSNGSTYNERLMMEVLLDKMLCKAPEQEASGNLYRFAPKSLTKFDYNTQNADLIERISETEKFSTFLRNKLIKGRYLFCFHSGNSGKGKTFPTKKGCNKGIVWGWTQHSEAYGNSYYTPRMEDFIWSHLRENENFSEGDTPEELMDGLCYLFEAYIRELTEALGKRSTQPEDVLSELEKLTPDFRKEKPEYSRKGLLSFLLHYLPVYAYEYREFFRRLCREVLCGEMSCKEELHAVSVGCGNMVDYWGLAEAFDAMEDSGRIHYTGIDLENWTDYCRLNKRKEDTVFPLMKQDALEYLEKQPELDADLYIFPKSISEFTGKTFDRLCGIFEKKKFRKEKVCLLTIFRTNHTNDASVEKDNQKCERIASAMEQNGFEVTYDSGEPDSWKLCEPNQMPYVWEMGHGFSWAEEMNKRINQLLYRTDFLYEEAAKKITDPALKPKEHYQSRKPMNHIYGCCRVLVFTKKKRGT